MASSADNMVRDAIKAYHNGSVDEARSLLLQAVEVDEANEQAWLWLSAVVESDHDRQTCLENVLTINPNNEKAQQGLRILKDRANTGGPPTRRQQMEAAAEDDDPFANVSFTEPASSADAPVSPFSSDDDEEELPDVAWGSLETSSASARPVVPEPSKDQYEDWISNLNIGGNNAEEFFGDNVEETADQTSDLGFSAAPFIGSDDIFSDEEPFELDESIFGLDDEVFQAGGYLVRVAVLSAPI